MSNENQTIRYIKLKNKGAFVAMIRVMYCNVLRTDEHGHVTYENNWHQWDPSGYHDICASAERTVDLWNDAQLSEGAQVRLVAVVAIGKDNDATEVFRFSKNSSNTASYVISGTTFHNNLSLISI